MQYNIEIEDLENTFVTYGFLQYKIESTNSGYNTNNERIDVPKADHSDTPIAYNISIPVGVTQTYTIYFRYPNSELSQDDDQGKSFTGRIQITPGSAKPTLMERFFAVNPTRSPNAPFEFELPAS